MKPRPGMFAKILSSAGDECHVSLLAVAFIKILVSYSVVAYILRVKCMGGHAAVQISGSRVTTQ